MTSLPAKAEIPIAVESDLELGQDVPAQYGIIAREDVGERLDASSLIDPAIAGVAEYKVAPMSFAFMGGRFADNRILPGARDRQPQLFRDFTGDDRVGCARIDKGFDGSFWGGAFFLPVLLGVSNSTFDNRPLAIAITDNSQRCPPPRESNARSYATIASTSASSAAMTDAEIAEAWRYHRSRPASRNASFTAASGAASS